MKPLNPVLSQPVREKRKVGRPTLDTLTSPMVKMSKHTKPKPFTVAKIWCTRRRGGALFVTAILAVNANKNAHEDEVDDPVDMEDGLLARLERRDVASGKRQCLMETDTATLEGMSGMRGVTFALPDALAADDQCVDDISLYLYRPRDKSRSNYINMKMLLAGSDEESEVSMAREGGSESPTSTLGAALDAIGGSDHDQASPTLSSATVNKGTSSDEKLAAAEQRATVAELQLVEAGKRAERAEREVGLLRRRERAAELQIRSLEARLKERAAGAANLVWQLEQKEAQVSALEARLRLTYQTVVADAAALEAICPQLPQPTSHRGGEGDVTEILPENVEAVGTVRTKVEIIDDFEEEDLDQHSHGGSCKRPRLLA